MGYDWVDAVRAECARRGLTHLRALVLFLFQTGFRVGEAVRLTSADFHPGQSAVRAGVTKNGAPRVMALTPGMAAELATLAPRDGRLFGYASTPGVRQGLRRVCAGAGAPCLGTHQPGRHSFATALEGLGMSARGIADAGGWKTARIVSDVYLHPDEPAARAARLLTRGGEPGANLAQNDAAQSEAPASNGPRRTKKGPSARPGPSLGRKRP